LAAFSGVGVSPEIDSAYMLTDNAVSAALSDVGVSPEKYTVPFARANTPLRSKPQE
jgi:hypothetical protein